VEVRRTVDAEYKRISPHPHEVLHHELVDGLGRMSHVNFAFPVTEVGLQVMSDDASALKTQPRHLLHNVRQSGSMIQMEAERERSLRC
jgi:hypothetical protein